MTAPDMNERRVKIEDVAEAAGVSIMSVSRAMRGVEGISASKREEILQIARKMGYFPNRVAVSLAASSSNLIGISVPTLFGTVFSEIYEGMRGTLERAGFVTIIDINEYSMTHEENWAERMISWRPAGIVLTGVDHSEATTQRLTRARIPILEIWDHSDNPINLCVGVDHHQAGQKMGQYLVELGYRRPAYIGVTEGLDVRADRRFVGLQRSFAEAGTEFLASERSSKVASFETGFDATELLLSNLSVPPDVICYLNDNMAFGGMMKCEREGLKCPSQIGIAGYNGLGINKVLPKRITTSVTPRFTMGEIGARILVAKILGARTQNTKALPVRIDEGETTRRQIP